MIPENNTGLRDLPPAQAALSGILPAYALFHRYGCGRTDRGRPCILFGSVPGRNPPTRLLQRQGFIYEWMRNFIRVVTLRPNGDFYKMEPFMENVNLPPLVDIEMGPDGQMYIPSMAPAGFTKNKDSGLFR